MAQTFTLHTLDHQLSVSYLYDSMDVLDEDEIDPDYVGLEKNPVLLKKIEQIRKKTMECMCDYAKAIQTTKTPVAYHSLLL